MLDILFFGGILKNDNLVERDWWSTWETMGKRLIKKRENRTPGFLIQVFLFL